MSETATTHTAPQAKHRPNHDWRLIDCEWSDAPARHANQPARQEHDMQIVTAVAALIIADLRDYVDDVDGDQQPGHLREAA